MAKKEMSKKTWIETLKKFRNLPPPIIEEVQRCYHEKLEKFIKDDFSYQCIECRCIVEVFGSALYTPEQYAIKALTINLNLARENEYVAKAITGLIEEAEKGSDE